MSSKKKFKAKNKKSNVSDNLSDALSNLLRDESLKTQSISSFLSDEKDLEVPKKNNSSTSDEKKVEKIVEKKEEILNLSTILDTDDKLLFSLNALGDLQKNEKLTENEELLSIDDRWFFQGVRRWWSDDNQNKSSNKTLEVITKTSERINKLLDDDFLAKQEEDKIPVLSKNNPKQKDKKLMEQNEERRRLINKYFVALNQAKTGMENIRDTYTYKNTKNKFKLSIQKTEDILDKLQKFKG